ncbi:hypothetical protein CPAR01_09073 [Colletotrichum paranaense]|uniref:Uncharacterized protein n=2 Tax=Colletotrichum acutatum species complex TaxID=2707335 RepID=A0AAI9XXM0_9PEZI|nr:uncharacterized protein CPAR01_09073 [Colletotrichum paranaense]KAK1464513.1 hypothetical protein CCUS01_08088 [Colletotrichum cuscutae]KAK1535531.1 hypothetical protein CPAR01_09073 [Colletotrichum paranaense]
MRRDGVAAARRRRSVQQPFPSPKLRRPVDLLPQPFFPQTLMGIFMIVRAGREGMCVRRKRQLHARLPSKLFPRGGTLTTTPEIPMGTETQPSKRLSDMNPATGKMPGWPALSYPTPVAPAEKLERASPPFPS